MRRRSRFVSLWAVVLTVLVGTVLGTAAIAPPAHAATGFTSTAVNQNGGNCLDVPGSSTPDGVQLIQWACHGGGNQAFAFTPVGGTTDQYGIGTSTSGKCVDVNGASTTDNATIVQRTCGTGANQKFRLVPVTISGTDKIFALQAVHSGVNGDQPRSWYENTPNGGDRYWWAVTNMQNEVARKFGLDNPDSRWLNVGEISAEGEGAGGGASPGWVVLSGHDADGAAGTGGQSMNRWYGGMVHEFGHAFGLPDSASTDGTPMSASFYDYPNTHFNQTQKNQILNGPYGSPSKAS